MEKKTCALCKEDKPLMAFHVARTKKFGRDTRCKECKSSLHLNRILGECKLETCSKKEHQLGYCAGHYTRFKRYGNPMEDKPLRTRDGSGWTDSNGYRVLSKKGHPLVTREDGRVMEHVFVMSEHLGRPLVPGENVHHKNGVRHDNRLENLEIWNTNQPAGQRAEDKVAYALEILRLYNPELLK